jgi:hypothetical protein
MSLVRPDARIADLVVLDVLDVRLDGSYAVNEEFLAACRAAYTADPRRLDDVVPDLILARAMARGYAGAVDLEGLTLALLEIGAAEPSA